MPELPHPDGDGLIEVQVVDEETHGGNEYVQVQATDDDITLSDNSGNAPWIERFELYEEVEA